MQDELGLLGQPLDRRHVAELGVHGQRAAGAHGLPVEQHGARPADLHVARALRPRQAEAVAEEVEQQLLGRHLAHDRRAVHTQLEIHARIRVSAPSRPSLRSQAAQYSSRNASRYLSACMANAASAGIGRSVP